jgi:hypothetical protein
MTAQTETRPTPGDALTEIASFLAALGMLTMVLFPFALPAIALAAVAVVPLLVLGLLVAAMAAVMTPPILLVRRIRRRNTARRNGGRDRDPAAARERLSAAPSARVARS